MDSKTKKLLDSIHSYVIDEKFKFIHIKAIAKIMYMVNECEESE